jgi:hypothetical protein
VPAPPAAPAPPAQPVAPLGAPQTVTLTAIADTYANAGAPDKSFGDSWSLFSRGTLGAASYMRFAVPAAPSGKVLRSAALRITTTTDGKATSFQPHAVSLANNNWNESTLTWNTRPSLSTQLGTLASATTLNATYLVGLTPSGIPASTQVTLAISSAGTDSLSVWSANHSFAWYRPQLVLTYS